MKVQCQLCPRKCSLKTGERGNCQVRINLDGKLQSLVYGNPCATHVDPIEKKPLFHVLPTTGAFSIANRRMHLHCKYCQNWQISQVPPDDTQNADLPPDEVVRQTIKAKCKSIAYTYTDPIIFYEYSLDTAKIAHEHNLLNIWVTAGYIEQKTIT